MSDFKNKEKFPNTIKLEDSWFEYDYNAWMNLLSEYHKARKMLEDILHDTIKPIPCKSWTKCYIYGNEPKNLAEMWNEINNYIEDQSNKGGWIYSHIGTQEVDVNTDPYDDFENLTEKYTVYAVVESKEDFRQSEEYLVQESITQELYNKVMELKDRIDERLKGTC